jgi:uncharacterized protein YkwD
MKRRAAGWVTLCALALGAPVLAANASRPQDATATEVAALVARKTGAFRAGAGLEGLTVNRALSDAAQQFADFMAGTDQYSHEADGRKPADRALAHGYQHCVLAENIAYRFSSSGFDSEQLAAQLMQGWEQSPRHRHNMLLPSVTDIGVGIARSERTQRYYAVQMFGRPKSAASRFQIVNGIDVPVRYQLDAATYELPPRVTRTHEGCFSGALEVLAPAPGAGGSIAPRSGARYTVQRDASGQVRVQASAP